MAKIYAKSKNIKYSISGERIFVREKDRCKNKQIKALNYGSTKKFNLIFSIILLFFLIKLTTITSFLLNLNNKKRSLIVFISSIKLKIDASGENIIFFGDSFKWCTPFKTPDEIYINGENQTEIKNKYSFDNTNNEIILNWYNPLETTNCMFRDCNKITEIDLSNFDDSNLLTMHYMFHGCSSIRSINMSHLKTPKLTDMGSLFRLCTSLKSINIENLNSAGVGPFHYIFQNCYALESINFPNINTLKANAITNNFDNCNNLKYLNLENAKIKTQDKSIFSIIKSNFIICTHSPKLIDIIETKSATLNCSENYCINQVEDDDCSSTSYKYNYKDKFYLDCPNNTYNNNYICVDCDKKCSSCSKESVNKDSCITCNNKENYYPKYDNNLNDFIDCYKSLEGYYFDSNNNTFKKCFKSCKTCDKNGDEKNHNCLECNEAYKYELYLSNYLNCYEKCPNYYYIEKEKNINKYRCTQDPDCPTKYNKLITDLDKCIDKCNNENNYEYEFRSKCYTDCPEGSVRRNNNSEIVNEFFCKPICDEDNPYEIISTQKCVKNCDMNNNNECILNFQKETEKIIEETENLIEEKEHNITVQDLILKNLEKKFTSNKYNTSNVDKGIDEIYKDKNMTVTFTLLTNQKNKEQLNNNETCINLGKCEDELRRHYSLSKDQFIYLKKIDVIIPGMKIPKVEYSTYAKLNGSNIVKLNLSICSNNIDIFVPVINSENLDILNSSSGYYNDVCYITKSDKNTDLSLKQRKKIFVEENKTVCQDDCNFEEYNNDTNKARCSCKIKEEESFFDNIKINKTKLFENFVDIKNLANVKIMECYKLLNNKNEIIKNIGIYIISIIIIFHFIFNIIFCCNQKNIIQKQIEEIAFGIRNWDLVQEDEKEKIKKKNNNRKIIKKNNIINNNKIQNKAVNNKNINNNKNQNKAKKNNNINYNKKKFINKNKVFNRNNLNKNKRFLPIGFNFFQIKNNKKHNPPIKSKGNNKIKLNNNILTTKNKTNSKSKIINKNKYKQEIIEKAKKVMNLNDQEKNILTYKSALKFDRRSYCVYYISLLRTKNILFFSFCNNNDYNSRIIKIDLFFINFVIYFTVNALFFNDNTMNKIYEDEGAFNLSYQLPQITYSFLISSFLNVVLKLLALSEKNIIELKKNKVKSDLEIRVKQLNSRLNIKFALYFIISFIVLLSFGYYLIMFCAVYRNTQIHLLKDTLISFGLTLIYPFGINLLPGIFRIPSLSKSKNNKKCLYNFSLLLQII